MTVSAETGRAARQRRRKQGTSFRIGLGPEL
jgi:hypothetical protein